MWDGEGSWGPPQVRVGLPSLCTLETPGAAGSRPAGERWGVSARSGPPRPGASLGLARLPGAGNA